VLYIDKWLLVLCSKGKNSFFLPHLDISGFFFRSQVVIISRLHDMIANRFHSLYQETKRLSVANEGSLFVYVCVCVCLV
jgi:hypothetical protein